MRSPSWLSASVVAAGLLLGGTALADREMTNFDEGGEAESAEALEAAKAQSRVQVSDFGAEDEVPVKPFPWMLVLLFGTTIAVAAPFAMRMYRHTSTEIHEANNAFGSRGKAAADAERTP
jgi:hypothetical protein